MGTAAVGAVKAGNAYVEIGAKLDPLKKAMRTVGASMVALGAALSAPLAIGIKTFASYGDQVGKMAKRTGLSTRAVSEMGHAAKLAGSSIDGLQTGMKVMARAVTDASFGLLETKRAFDLVGISVDDIIKLRPEQQFEAIAEAISKIEDPTKKAYAAQKLFGRSGTMLIPLLNQGAEGIRKARQEAQLFGISMSTETAAGAERLTDNMSRLGASIKGVWLTIGKGMMPLMDEWLPKITSVVVLGREWIADNSELIGGLAKVAAGMIGIGAAMLGVLAVGKVFAIMFSPVGIFGVAVAGIALLAKNWDSITQFMSDKFDSLGASIIGIWDVVVQALPKMAADMAKGVLSFIEGILIAARKIAPWLSASGKALIKPLEDAERAVKRVMEHAVPATYQKSLDKTKKMIGAFAVDASKFVAQFGDDMMKGFGLDKLKGRFAEILKEMKKLMGVPGVPGAAAPGAGAPALAGAGAITPGEAFGTFAVGKIGQQIFGTSIQEKQLDVQKGILNENKKVKEAIQNQNQGFAP